MVVRGSAWPQTNPLYLTSLEALARAIYHRPNILLLDDVLSALDARTEAEVVRNLLDSDGLFRRLNMTVVLVTHAGKDSRPPISLY